MSDAIWVVAEVLEGAPTRLTLELATLVAGLAGERGASASVVLVGDEGAAEAIAAHGPDVLVVAPPGDASPSAAEAAALVAALIEERQPDLVLVGATPDGRDMAGTLVGLTDLPVLVNAGSVTSAERGISVESSIFGGRLISRSILPGDRGILVVLPGAATASPAGQAGRVEPVTVAARHEVAAVTLVDRAVEALSGPSIDDARVIVGVGRGIGGPEGLAIVERLADAFEGAVGATRAAVDSGWIDFAQQIGQTGKTVKPDLYIACGISGAIQHKVGAQASGTIVAINKDPEAPISDFADMVVVGDLFEIVPLLEAAVRDARGSG